jgi:hypothetical protein
VAVTSNIYPIKKLGAQCLSKTLPHRASASAILLQLTVLVSSIQMCSNLNPLFVII